MSFLAAKTTIGSGVEGAGVGADDEEEAAVAVEDNCATDNN
jgi:hypothetical protein